MVRNALYLLVLIASRPLSMAEQNGNPSTGTVEGLTVESLKPLLTEHSRLLDDIVEKVTSGDHALSANALRFLNALLQDALATFTESQFMRFVKRLQDLNVFTIIEEMMRSDITADFTEPIAEFQRLYKDVLRTWKSTPVDLTRPMHQDALSIIQRSVHQKRGSLATWEDRKKQKTRKSAGSEAEAPAEVSWSSLGFQNEHDPAPDFDETGLLGLIDLADFAQSHTDFLKKAMLEQAVTPKDRWCPIARVSLTVPDILTAYFGIAQIDDQDDSDPLGQQLLLGRDKLHGTIAHAFFRLWESAGATVAEFDKIEELVRLMVAKLLFEGGGHDSMAEVEDAINRTTLAELRIWQVEELEQVQSQALGHDLRYGVAGQHLVQWYANTETVGYASDYTTRRCILWWNKGYNAYSMVPGFPWRSLIATVSRRTLSSPPGLYRRDRLGGLYSCRPIGVISTTSSSMKRHIHHLQLQTWRRESM